MVLSEFERRILSEVSKERSWEHVKWFAERGEKLSGTPSNEQSVEYILKTLKGYGVQSSAPEFQAWLDFPKLFDAELRVTFPEPRSIEAMPLAQMASTPLEGVEGELIYVDGGGLADYEGKNVRGKIVLAEFHKGPARPWKNFVAGVMKGASGLIIVSYDAPFRVFNRGTVKSIWGNPTPENIEDIGKIPALLITAEEGLRLRELLGKGVVRVWLRGVSERGWARTRQPMAMIQGREPSFVLVGSHMDAWGGAASCNAVGCASSLEIARVFLKHQTELRRGVELLWFQGHETGIMTGSTWYVDNFWDRLHRDCVAYLNNDTPCMVDTTVYAANADPVYQEFVQSTVKELAEEEGVQFRKIEGYKPTKTGDQSFYGVGIPSARVLTVPPPGKERPLGGWWYHSDLDTLDKCNIDTLYMANKAHVLVLLRLCMLPILPYKITPIADWTLEALKGLNAKALGSIDLSSILDKTEVFRKTAIQLDKSNAELSEACKIETDLIRLEGRLKQINRTLLRICRVMNPVNYTLDGKYGQDHYGAEYILPIPVLQQLSELVELNPDTSSYKSLRTKLIRQRNLVSDAIEDATYFADQILNTHH